jgi:hypothetical protein
MATCPHCKGHLTDGHRCPRRRVFVVAEIIASGLAGGLAGLLLFARLFTSRDDMDAVGILGGAAIAIWINRSLRS